MLNRKGPAPRAVADRFWEKVQRADVGCWEWSAARAHGYGRVLVGSRADGSRRVVMAHRLAYELAVGPIPEGLDLDHLCANPGCVRPDHLEPVTHHENMVRGVRTRYRASWTHCKYGHEFTDENTLIEPKTGKRRCRTCKNDWQRAAWHRRKNVES